MKLVKVKIENFRGYKNSEIELSKLSVIIGKNDVGKSTLLDALNIFFENEKPLENDANVYSGKNEISITCFFEINPNGNIFLDSAKTEKTQTTLESEYLLDNNGLLQIKKIFEKGKLKNTYIVANYPDNWDNPLITLKISDLKKVFDNIEEKDKNEEFKKVNKTIKKSMREFLFKREKQNLNFSIQEIEINSKEKDLDIVNIYEKLKIQLPTFMLFRVDRTNTDKDSEVTDITKAIAKNAVSEVAEQFETIKKEIINKIQEFSNLTLEKLKDFDEEIANSLSVDLKDKALESIFSYDFKSDDDIPFNKRGSGVKRLFLLSFFIADSERQNHSNMIYAIEEPETSQHPNFQRMIIETLKTISQNQQRQVIITTHTPEIVKLANKDDIIFIQKNKNNNEIAILQNGNLDIKELVKTLGILPYVSYKGVVFVEGKSDIGFFNNLNRIEDLREIFDINNITIIPLNCKGNVEVWIKQNYLKDTNVKQLYFIDKDKKEKTIIAEQENIKSIITKKREIENYYPIDIVEEYFRNKLKLKSIFSEKNITNWDNEDIANLIYQKSNGLKEQAIKGMFNCKEIWEKITKDNLQGFDEIKSWFEIMQDFFKN